MNGNIIYCRLMNRVYLKNENDIPDIFKLARTNNVSINIGNNGGTVPGPYIDKLYISMKDIIPVKDFIQFLTQLADYCDMYQGFKPFTYMEIALKFTASDGNSVYNGKAKIVIYYNTQKEIYILKPNDAPILKLLNPIRITEEYVQQNNNIPFLTEGKYESAESN